MKKTIITIGLVITMITGIFNLNVKAEEQNKFIDVPDKAWFAPSVNELYRRGLTSGTTSVTYSPNKNLTVEECIAFVVRTLDKEIDKVNPKDGEAWSAPYIKRAMDLGLITKEEYKDYTVSITREQIAKLLVRGIQGETFTEYKKYEKTFKDYNTLKEKEYVLKAYEKGLISGYPDGTFGGNKLATRAEAATMILRMVDKDYRIQMYSGIPYVPKTDLNEWGEMNQEASYRFAMYALSNLKIYEKNGKVIVEGNNPEVPEGQKFVIDIDITTKESRSLKFLSNTSWVEETKIPYSGEFKRELNFSPKEVGQILIYITIINRETGGDYCTFILTKRYYDLSNPTHNYFAVTNTDLTGHRMDMNLVKGVFGW